jgi:hypothetical protein
MLLIACVFSAVMFEESVDVNNQQKPGVLNNYNNDRTLRIQSTKPQAVNRIVIDVSLLQLHAESYNLHIIDY